MKQDSLCIFWIYIFLDFGYIFLAIATTLFFFCPYICDTQEGGYAYQGLVWRHVNPQKQVIVKLQVGKHVERQ